MDVGNFLRVTVDDNDFFSIGYEFNRHEFDPIDREAKK